MSAPEINDYRFGHIVIDDQAYEQDVIILPDGVRGGWWRQEGHVLHPDDLDVVFETVPDLLVVGQGAYSRMAVTQETRQSLEDAGIELQPLDTQSACQRYNEMREQRVTAAALHLTC